MNRFLKFIIAGMAIAPILAGCSKDDGDYPGYYAYVTVNTDGPSYYFTGDDGKTYYPGDVSRIIPPYKALDKDGVSTNGKRAYIRFNYLSTKKDGFDYNIALYYIEDIQSQVVKVAESEDDVNAAGDGEMELSDSGISGGWLDILFRIETSRDATHKITLLDNKTVEAPSTMPEGYQYLEFRQSTTNMGSGTLGYGIVSFKLDDTYNPAVTGKKGFYIRVRDLDGNVKYATIEYKAPSQKSTMELHRIPTPHMDRFR